jgi:hypothetical protein
MNGEGHQMIPLLCHTYENPPYCPLCLPSLKPETSTKHNTNMNKQTIQFDMELMVRSKKR